MKTNKAIQLLQLLSSKEKKQFQQRIQHHKRKSLIRLYEVLQQQLKKQTDIVATTLYELVYQEPYTSDKNYLLRNEMRHLSKEIHLFLTEQKILKDIAKNTTTYVVPFLRVLLEKKAYELFEIEVKKALNQALKITNYQLADEVMKLYIDYFMLHKEARVETYEELHNFTKQHEVYTTKNFLYKFLTIRQKRAFAERTLKAFDADRQVAPLENIILDWSNPKYQEPYLQYLQLVIQAQAYPTNGQPKIKFLKDALAFLPKIKVDGFKNKLVIAATHAAIALEYFLLSDYENAIVHHQQTFALSKHIPDNQLLSYVFNYFSTLLRVENYEQAVQLIETYDTLLQSNPKLKDRFLCLKAMCYIFLRLPEKAMLCVPQNTKGSGLLNHFYFRLILIIVFYLRKQLTLALNETNNFLHSLNYHKTKDESYKILALYVNRYLRLYDKKEIIGNYKAKLTELQLDIKTDNILKSQQHNTLLNKWLLQEIEREI